jgi:hypothetical protein
MAQADSAQNEKSAGADASRKGRLRLRLRVERVSWRDLTMSVGPVIIITVIAIGAVLHFARPAPPHSITMTAGPKGSMLWNFADRYRQILARDGITLNVLESEGAVENLKRLADPAQQIEVGFVQGGLASLPEVTDQVKDLVSLGSVFYEPLSIFYHGKPVMLLSQFEGKRISIGSEGSGARELALTLLRANGIEAKNTRLLDLEGMEAAHALEQHRIDAAFMMGDTATRESMRELLHKPGIRLYDFIQADAYVGRFRYLTKLALPQGALDFGANLPARTIQRVAPTVELIARPDLHPALSDLLIGAAREVHGRATMNQRAGEFPAPLEHEYPISDDAARYYKSGKGFVYRYLPFWLASLVDRIGLVLLPIIVVLIPGLRLAPVVYGWLIRTRIYRRYGELMALERAALSNPAPELRAQLQHRLDAIERTVIALKMPRSFAEQLYVLRQHIEFVRGQLVHGGTPHGGPPQHAGS